MLKTLFGHISGTNGRRDSGLVSKPPYEIAINPIFRSYHVSDVIIQSFLNRSR